MISTQQRRAAGSAIQPDANPHFKIAVQWSVLPFSILPKREFANKKDIFLKK